MLRYVFFSPLMIGSKWTSASWGFVMLLFNINNFKTNYNFLSYSISIFIVRCWMCCKIMNYSLLLCLDLFFLESGSLTQNETPCLSSVRGSRVRLFSRVVEKHPAASIRRTLQRFKMLIRWIRCIRRSLKASEVTRWSRKHGGWWRVAGVLAQ